MSPIQAQTTILRHMVELDRPEPMVNILEVLNQQLNYQAGFDLAMEMQNKNFIKIVYCTFPSVINVQLTLVGQEWHRKTLEK